MGRFIIGDNGQKLYQLAPCTSTYKIEKDRFVKQSKDCGHSEQVMSECRMQIQTPIDKDVLPDVKPVDIKGRKKLIKMTKNWASFFIPAMKC